MLKRVLTFSKHDALLQERRRVMGEERESKKKNI
jgi:hypothetical protein